MGRDSQLFHVPLFRSTEATGIETAAQLPNLFNLRYSDFRDMRRPKRAAPRMAKEMTVTSCFAPRGSRTDVLSLLPGPQDCNYNVSHFK